MLSICQPSVRTAVVVGKSGLGVIATDDANARVGQKERRRQGACRDFRSGAAFGYGLELQGLEIPNLNLASSIECDDPSLDAM
jgi:hypothetical protein